MQTVWLHSCISPDRRVENQDTASGHIFTPQWTESTGRTLNAIHHHGNRQTSEGHGRPQLCTRCKKRCAECSKPQSWVWMWGSVWMLRRIQIMNEERCLHIYCMDTYGEVLFPANWHEWMFLRVGGCEGMKNISFLCIFGNTHAQWVCVCVYIMGIYRVQCICTFNCTYACISA